MGPMPGAILADHLQQGPTQLPHTPGHPGKRAASWMGTASPRVLLAPPCRWRLLPQAAVSRRQPPAPVMMAPWPGLALVSLRALALSLRPVPPLPQWLVLALVQQPVPALAAAQPRCVHRVRSTACLCYLLMLTLMGCSPWPGPAGVTGWEGRQAQHEAGQAQGQAQALDDGAHRVQVVSSCC
jgi:hypothetical protein